MTLYGMITICIVFLLFIALLFERFEADLVMFTALVLLMVVGVLSPDEALIGFSNEATLTIGALFIVVHSIENTHFIKKLPEYIIGHEKSPQKAIFKLMIPVAGISAFMNNTPLVVILTPLVRKWAKKIGVPETKLLIPLSYAAIFGGMCTLIGTSTNIVVSGLLMDRIGKGFSMFELGLIGIPCAITGILYMTFIGSKILPNRQTFDALIENHSEYLAEMKITSSCSLIGKTVKEANLRNLTGVYLITIIRNGKNVFPISGGQKLHAGDSLIFTGDIQTIVELEKIQGLTLEFDSEVSMNHLQNDEIGLAEVVVSKGSILCNRTIKEIDFRSKYNAVIIAVFRNGKRIHSKIGSIHLKSGDVLLTLLEKKYYIDYPNKKDFYFISMTTKRMIHESNKKSIFLMTIFIMMVLSVGLGLLKMITAVFLVVVILLFSKCISIEEARKSIEWNLLIMIGSSFGIAKALEKTGVAKYIAEIITNHAMSYGPIVILSVIFLITWITTEILTNNAAATLIFPIAYSVAEQMTLSPLPFAITIAIAASTSFSTPIGYQTNLIVYGTGGYKFSDFMKVGIPLCLINMIVSIIIIPYFWPF